MDNNDDNKITKLDTVIRNSLETYDTNQLKFKKFIAKVKYIKFIDNKNLTDHIVFYDKNKKKLFDSAYEVMGIFVPQNNMWKWSWSIPNMKNKYLVTVINSAADYIEHKRFNSLFEAREYAETREKHFIVEIWEFQEEIS